MNILKITQTQKNIANVTNVTIMSLDRIIRSLQEIRGQQLNVISIRDSKPILLNPWQGF